MLLKQVFKSLAGAQKRAAFENAHSDTHRFYIMWFLDGKPVITYNRARAGDYTWQLEKTRRVIPRPTPSFSQRK